EDVLVRKRLAQRWHGLHLRRDARVEIRHDHIVELEEARCWEQVVGIVSGIGLEQFESDLQQVFPLERAAQALLLRARNGDVVVPGLSPLRFLVPGSVWQNPYG